MLSLAWLTLLAQSAARDHCSCHSVKSRTFTRLMYERGFRAAVAHRASDLKFSPPPRRDLMKPVLEELWRSLRAERRQVTTTDGAAREMARALNETGDWVLVYNNRVYVPTEYYHAADHARHATMIRETAALVGLPNAIYVVNIEILPRTSPLRSHDRGDAGRASSRAADGRRRPPSPVSKRRTADE